MKPYIVRRNEYKDFIMHEVFMNNRVEYAYYEKTGNSFINKVYVVMGSFCYIGGLLENSLYVFCSDVGKLNELFFVLKEEYSNLKFTFVLWDDSYLLNIQNFVSTRGVLAEVIMLEEYLKRREFIVREKDSLRNQSFYQNSKSVLKDKKEEQMGWNVDKDYADYNGFNERLIDRNVKNIVQIKKGNGDNNEL